MQEEFDDQLPDSIAIKKNNEDLSNKQADLLEQVLDHIGKDQYITWEKIQLPSEGVYYDDKIPGGYIEVKPMGVDVDKMLTNQRLVQTGQLLSKIVESCTRLPEDFEVREMLAGDFNFVLYYLRGITHGDTYEFVSKCPACGTNNMYEFNLMELAQTIKKPDPNHPEEPMKVNLPILSGSFKKDINALIRLVRVDDIMKMSRPGYDETFDPVKKNRAKIRNKKDKTEIKNDNLNQSKIYEDSMKMQIVAFEIDGHIFEDDRKINLINKLHQRDSAKIREFIDDISPGIDTSLEVKCQNEECEQESTISLPWSEKFFRPNK